MHTVQKKIVLRRCRGSEGCSVEGCGRGALCHSWEGTVIFFRQCRGHSFDISFCFASGFFNLRPQNWWVLAIEMSLAYWTCVPNWYPNFESQKFPLDRGGWSVCRGCQCTGASSKSIRSSGDGDKLEAVMLNFYGYYGNCRIYCGYNERLWIL